MEFDLKSLGAFLCETGLMNKGFSEMNELEIIHFCEQVHCATIEHSGLKPPYLNEKDELIIPHDCPPKYRHWIKGNQSILETLTEIGASDEIIKRYVRTEAGGLTRLERDQGKADQDPAPGAK